MTWKPVLVLLELEDADLREAGLTGVLVEEEEGGASD